jgi:hypothetical protein
MRLLPIIILIALTGCSAAKKANRKLNHAKRLIAEAEALGAKWESDTIMQTVELKVPERHTDTLVHILSGDTIVKYSDHVRLRIIRLPGDTIKAECDCDSAKEKQLVIRTIYKTIHAPAKEERWHWWHVVLGLFIGAAVMWVYRK